MYVAQIGQVCKEGYAVIMSQEACDNAAKNMVVIYPEFNNWVTDSNGHSAHGAAESWANSHFLPGNNYTKGCYWNNGGKTLWFNPYGVEAQCTGHQDCRTLCKKSGM